MPNKPKKQTRRRSNPMPPVQQSYLQLVHPDGSAIRFTVAQLKLAPTSQFIAGADDHTTLIANTDSVGVVILAHFPGVLSINQPEAQTQEKK